MVTDSICTYSTPMQNLRHSIPSHYIAVTLEQIVPLKDPLGFNITNGEKYAVRISYSLIQLSGCCSVSKVPEEDSDNINDYLYQSSEHYFA